jgi:hypothetical protein
MFRTALVVFCVIAFTCVYIFRADANSQKMAAGLICDTAEQALMVGTLYDELGPEKALAKVNEDAKDPTACVIAQFVYIEGKRGAVVKAGGKDWITTEILITGVNTPAGVQQVPPKVFYTLLPAEGLPA